jgi:hypothetical protein
LFNFGRVAFVAVIFALAILAGFGENIFGDFLGILRNFIFPALIMVRVQPVRYVLENPEFEEKSQMGKNSY